MLIKCLTLYCGRKIMTNRRTLTASNIRYLLTMKELDRDGCGVRCVDLASALNLSKPSVHNMMDTFSELGIISKTSYGVAHFTDSGNDTAHRYGHYYEIVSESLRCMFPDIGDLQMAVCSLLSEVPQDSLEHMSRRYEQEREKSNGSRLVSKCETRL